VTDVLIAGAGIAGSALAVHLGRSGFSVMLFERSPFPREKPCGEGLMPAGVAALERLGVETENFGADFEGIRYHFLGRMVQGRFSGCVGQTLRGRGMRRRELDAALAAAAGRTPGVSLNTGVRVGEPLVEGGRVTGLLVEKQSVRARLVVAADGAQSRLRHALELDRPTRRKRVGMRMHFRSARGTPAATHVEVFLGRGHELYVTPLPSGEFLVAALAEAEALNGRTEDLFWRWCQAQPNLAERISEAEPISELLVTAPLSGRARSRVLPGLVLLGDAAGFTDPITGGGMTQALQGAESLAEHLAVSHDWNEATHAAFDRQRETALRDYRLITSGLLWLSTHPRLIGPGLDIVRAAPPFLSHLLGVSGGVRRLFGRQRVHRGLMARERGET